MVVRPHVFGVSGGKRAPGVLYAFAHARGTVKNIVGALAYKAVEVDVGIFKLVYAGVAAVLNAGVKGVPVAGVCYGKCQLYVELSAEVGHKSVVDHCGAAAIDRHGAVLIGGMHGHFDIVPVVRHDAPKIAAFGAGKRRAVGTPCYARGVGRKAESEKIFHFLRISFSLLSMLLY